MVSLWSLAHGTAVLEYPPNHELFLVHARSPAIGFGVTQSVFLGEQKVPDLSLYFSLPKLMGIGMV